MTDRIGNICDGSGREQVRCITYSGNLFIPANTGLLSPGVERRDDFWASDRLEFPESIIGDNILGHICHSFGDENLFYRIWFTPIVIAAGFIVEEVEYPVSMWNAFLDTVSVVSDIQFSGETEGISVTSYTPPFNINKFGEQTALVVLSREGPPLQSTIVRFIIDGVNYDITVTGIRIIPWDIEPNWDKRVKLTMNFETVLERTKYFIEQRRPLRESSFRETSFGVLVQGIQKQKLKNIILYGSSKMFGVPIFSEECIPASDFNGADHIHLSNATTYLWHLINQVDYALIIDYVNMVSEIKEIDSVTTNQITFVREIDQTFNYLTSIVYPIFFGAIDSVNTNFQTDNLNEVDIVFREFIFG